MSRSHGHTRPRARSFPRGLLEMHVGGYGFVQTSEGEFFIPRSKMNGAFDGDMVEVAPLREEHSKHSVSKNSQHDVKRTARVVRVIEHAHEQLVGRYEVAEPFGVVVPDDPRIPYDIFTRLADNPDVPDGAIVRVRITAYPTRRTAATGVVEEVIGDEDDEHVAIDLVVARYKLETEFSAEAIAQANAAETDTESALAEGYRDLRERVVFTIDPADARDFDDAVSVEPAERQGRHVWRVGVHIADVSRYVPWGSSIDLDARRRATSVYLVDRVIPMLPEALSNEICSLKPNEDRCTMTVDMYVNEAGTVIDADLYPAVIRSQARLTYDEALTVLEMPEDASTCEIMPDEVSLRIRTLADIADLRAARRKQAGGIDFDTVEARVRLDELGRPIDVDIRRRTRATGLIEEAMIMANETVARYLRDHQFPCIYRVHEPPLRDSLEALVPVLQEFPWFKRIDKTLFVAGNPHEIARVLDESAKRPESTLVSTLVLRSMKRAVYRPELDIHYGLASEAYAHFTSPIRRYPDLVVHRMLKAALFGRPQKFDQEVSALPWLAEHSSKMERVADKAARDSQDVKLVELMELHVGETFSALIVAVGTYGLLVQLDNTAEGVVEIRTLGHEYFALDGVRQTLTGSDTGRTYRLGQRVAVILTAADRALHRLEFRLVTR